MMLINWFWLRLGIGSAICLAAYSFSILLF